MGGKDFKSLTMAILSPASESTHALNGMDRPCL
jgi:hypothetical protein